MRDKYDLRLAGGEVLLSGREPVSADVLVAEGRIAGICAHDAPADAIEVVSVRGLMVLPGVIDAHVHLARDITVPKDSEDVEPETAAGAAGGVSTLIAYLMTPQPYEDVLPAAVELMETSGHIDFGFHFCIVTPEQLESIPHYARELGVSSFKFFMNFRGDEGKYLGLPGNDDGFLYELLRRAAEAEGMVDPHGENIEIVWRLRGQPPPEDVPALEAWNWVRPPLVESEAQQRAAFLASATGASMYAVHVTNAQTADVLCRQRDRYPNIFLETCPHYLTHDVGSDLGAVAKVNPPLRTSDDREALWEAIAQGRIDVVGSDHVPRHRSAKTDDIWTSSAGFPGIETLLPVLLSEGHVKRGIPLRRIMDTVTTRPAVIFGLHPQKGSITIGADADLAIVDLDGKQTVRAETQHSAAGYTIYDGWDLDCVVEHTLVRGEFALRDREVLPGARGRFQPRHRSGAAAIEAIQ